VFRVIAVALAAIIGGAVPCSAGGLAIEAPNNLPATPGSSGSFDLFLMNTNLTGGASYEVSSDQFVLSLSGPLGISFTGVSIATDPVAAPYIFVLSTDSYFGLPLSLNSYPNSTFMGTDLEFASTGFRTVNPGDTFGLAHVSYAVSSSTLNGIDSITIAPSPESLLTMVDGTSISFGITNGSIAVGRVIPEPWALTQAATAVLIGLGLVWRRRVRQET